jgi:putative zinc finger/helix-turn-helix YgiT family protein
MAGHRENYRETLAGSWSVVIEDVMVHRCAACGNYEVTFERLSPLYRALARAVVLKPSRLAGEEVTFLRNHLGLTGRELARTLGVSPAALSRWEQGKDPIGGTSDRALRLVVGLEPPMRGALTRESLAAIEGGNGEPLQLVASLRAGEWTVEGAGAAARTAA